MHKIQDSAAKVKAANPPRRRSSARLDCYATLMPYHAFEWQRGFHMRRHYPALFARALPVLAAAVPALAIGLTPAQALAQISIGINFGGPDAGVGIRIGYAPPPMPVYVQPPLPAPDYIWVPGHWAWSDYVDDYYWVPGYWELPPQPGLLWTPALWGWEKRRVRLSRRLLGPRSRLVRRDRLWLWLSRPWLGRRILAERSHRLQRRDHQCDQCPHHQCLLPSALGA